jgi:ubiquinone/menaquinone biosynthesis C-methylase UbiE
MGADTSLDPNAIYSLGSSPGETGRLLRQAAELAAANAALIDRVSLRPGDSAIDLGCGPVGIFELLAERVGAAGRVIGLDADPKHVEMATELVASRRLSNVGVLLGDARHTGLDASSFDVVHARTLLINVPDPGEVVAEMARLTKPGGWVLSFEPDCGTSVCYPPNPSYDRLAEIFPAVFSRNGADWQIGRRVAELYRAAGLVDVQVEARADIYPKGHTRRTILIDLVRSMRRYVLELKLATDQELEQLFADALCHLENPDTIVMPNLFFLVSGHKPTNAERPRLSSRSRTPQAPRPTSDSDLAP